MHVRKLLPALAAALVLVTAPAVATSTSVSRCPRPVRRVARDPREEHLRAAPDQHRRAEDQLDHPRRRLDTTKAVTNTRKLISEDKVDVVVGSTITPNSLAMVDVVADAERR